LSSYRPSKLAEPSLPFPKKKNVAWCLYTRYNTMYTMEIYIHVNNVVILLYFATSVFIVTSFILFAFYTMYCAKTDKTDREPVWER